MNYDRISSYQVDAFFSELAKIQLYKMSDYIVMPLGIHVSKKMEITVVVPEMTSLHELIHEPTQINWNEQGLSLQRKLTLLIELAKVMNQFHTLATPMAHGSLNPHNIFVDYSQGLDNPKVLLGEIEMSDFKRYANMFYTYRSVTVYSPPECLS